MYLQVWNRWQTRSMMCWQMLKFWTVTEICINVKVTDE
jgi:hypothetical protein